MRFSGGSTISHCFCYYEHELNPVIIFLVLLDPSTFPFRLDHPLENLYQKRSEYTICLPQKASSCSHWVIGLPLPSTAPVRSCPRIFLLPRQTPLIPGLNLRLLSIHPRPPPHIPKIYSNFSFPSKRALGSRSYYPRIQFSLKIRFYEFKVRF